MQKFKKHSDELKKDSLDTLRESFHNIQAQEVEEIKSPWEYEEQEQEQASTKTIKLNVGQVSSCGCGGSTAIEVWRTVPMDSPLNDGDTVDEFEDEDIIIE